MATIRIGPLATQGPDRHAWLLNVWKRGLQLVRILSAVPPKGRGERGSTAAMFAPVDNAKTMGLRI